MHEAHSENQKSNWSCGRRKRTYKQTQHLMYLASSWSSSSAAPSANELLDTPTNAPRPKRCVAEARCPHMPDVAPSSQAPSAGAKPPSLASLSEAQVIRNAAQEQTGKAETRGNHGCPSHCAATCLSNIGCARQADRLISKVAALRDNQQHNLTSDHQCGTPT